MTKYYEAHNAGGRTIGGQTFEITEIVAGTAVGVFQADDPKTIEAIEKDVASKKGVTEITFEQYDSALKKKPQSFNSYPHSNIQYPQARLSQVAGVVVEGGIEPPEDESAKLDTVESALENLGRVAPPPVDDEPVRTLSENQKRRNK